MTLPVSFNEPTSLLQRVTEDMVCPFLSFTQNSPTPPRYGQQDHVSGAKLEFQRLSLISCKPDHDLEN